MVFPPTARTILSGSFLVGSAARMPTMYPLADWTRRGGAILRLAAAFAFPAFA